MNLLFLARRYMGQRRTRAVLTILAIVFGTATLYAANAMPGAVQAAAERTALGEDGATLTIAQGFTGRADPLSETQVPALEALPGVESAVFSAEGDERDNTISLKLAPGASLTDVAQAVETAIGDYSVLGIDPRRSLLQNQFYQVLFNFFGGISLLIGSFLIYVTIRTSAAERRRELGILRAIGADQGQVVRLFTLEALLLAVIGTIVGMIVGQLFAIGMFQMVWSTSFQMYEQEGGVPLNLTALLAAAAIGIVVSLTAAYFPARAASRITPIEAIRQEAPAVTLRAARWRILLGLLVTVVSILVLISGTAWSALGGLLLFISAALSAPALLLPAVGALRPIFTRLFPRLADLVYAGILRQPWRAATTLSVLTIGFALCVGVMGLISQTVADTAERINAQDPDRDLALYGMEQGLPDRVALSVGELPEADAVARVYHVTATADGQPVLVESVDTRHGNRLRSFNRLLSGEEPDPPYLDNAAADAIVASLADGRGAIISYRLSQLTGASVGDSVVLDSPGGPRSYEVVALSDDFWPEANDRLAYIAEPTLLADFPEATLWAIYISLADVRQAAPLADQISAALFTSEAPVFVSNEVAFRERMIGDTVRGMSVLYVLALMVAVPSVLGLLNTLVIAVLERTREIGLVRAIGADRRQIRRMVIVESLLLGTMGLLFGGVVGLAIAYGVNASLTALQATGAPATFTIPVNGLLILGGGGLLLSALAAFLPANRAARLDVIGALRTE